MTPPKILHRPQEDQAQKKGAEKPELLVIDSRATLHDLLRQIQQNVTYFLEHKDPKIRSTIYAILDKVAEVFRSSGDWALRRLLEEIYTKDKPLWSRTEWEIIKPDDPLWHEENNPNAHKRTGITPNDILILPKSHGKLQIRPGVELKPVLDRELRLAHIYGATTKVLSPALHR